jgi:hypothetical protein
MKIKLYISDPDKAGEVISKAQMIIKEATGTEPNIKIVNQSGIK